MIILHCIYSYTDNNEGLRGTVKKAEAAGLQCSRRVQLLTNGRSSSVQHIAVDDVIRHLAVCTNEWQSVAVAAAAVGSVESRHRAVGWVAGICRCSDQHNRYARLSCRLAGLIGLLVASAGPHADVASLWQRISALERLHAVSRSIWLWIRCKRYSSKNARYLRLLLN